MRMDSQPTDPSISISLERRARLSAGLLHSYTSQGPGVMAVGTASQDHLGTALEKPERQHEDNGNRTAKIQECPHPNKRPSSAPGARASSPTKPAMPILLDTPGEGAPSQPMPWAWEEGRAATGISVLQLENSKPAGSGR